MSVAEGVASVLLGCISIGLACFLVFWCWRKYQVALLRHRLFVLRDELFDLALDGTLNFSGQAYVMQRQSINSMIRFAHHVSFARMLLYWYFCQDSEFESHERRWSEALVQLDGEEAKERIEEIRHRFLLAVVTHTTVGWLSWKISGEESHISRHPSRNTKRLLRRAARKLDVEAQKADEAKREADLAPATA